MNGKVTVTKGGLTIFEGRATRLYQAIVIKRALKAAKIGIRMNRHMSPTALLRTAGNITGKTYKRGQYDEAVYDLGEWVTNQHPEMEIVKET